MGTQAVTTCRELRAKGGWAEDAAGYGCQWPIAWRNTYSNIGYCLAGIWVVKADPTPFGVVMCLALCLLAIGSAWYHGHKTRLGNSLDWMGMYATMLLLVLHGIAPHAPLIAALFTFAWALLFGGVFSFKPKHFDWHMGGFFLLACLPVVLAGEWRTLLLPVTCFALGYIAWRLDKKRKVVGLWGHAIWHGVTAVAMASLYAAQV
jgi:hypothetical protein